MCFSALVFLTRLPSLTPDEFRDYYENKHIPLIKQQAPKFERSISRTRHYIAYTSNDSASYTPNVVLGESGFCDFDAVVEYRYSNEQQFHAFNEAMFADEVRQIRERDEEKFIDRTKTRLITLAATCNGSCYDGTSSY